MEEEDDLTPEQRAALRAEFLRPIPRRPGSRPLEPTEEELQAIDDREAALLEPLPSQNEIDDSVYARWKKEESHLGPFEADYPYAAERMRARGALPAVAPVPDKLPAWASGRPPDPPIVKSVSSPEVVKAPVVKSVSSPCQEPVKESGRKEVFTIHLPPEAARMLREMATENCQSLSAVAAMAIAGLYRRRT